MKSRKLSSRQRIQERHTRKAVMEQQATPTHPARQVLREETAILRWLFGYSNTQGLNTSPRWLHCKSTWQPQKWKTRFRRVTLVAIDVDELKEQGGIPTQFHMGVSVLHTQDLHDQCHSSSRPKPSIIQSHHWVVENSAHMSSNSNRFRFWHYQCVPLCRLAERLKHLLGGFGAYPLILVVHGGHRERTVLRTLGIDLKPIFTVDTLLAARYPLQRRCNLSLSTLLTDFGIHFETGHLHVAGNDAHFTLRVILMIAACDARRETDKDPAWVPAFEAIAQSPVQMPLKRHQRAAIKKRDRKTMMG
jgi:hypothetical protein